MGKYLTEKDRYQIEGYRKIGMKVPEIAKLLGKCERTIYYELKRGKTLQRDTEYREKEVYLADVAQNKYLENRTAKGAKLKIGNDIAFANHIEYMIREMKYSPYAVLQDIKNRGLKFKTSICTVTLYNYISKGIFLTISNKDLPVKKNPKKQEYKRTVALHNLKATSIEERPKEILKREQYGHWEMDTVVGGQGKGKEVLLVLSERKIREEIIIRMENKKSESTVKALNRIEREIGTKNFQRIFLSITMDNGVEFLDFEGIEKGRRNKNKPRTKAYYCHPYSSYERGTNENTNKLIRRFIPKGARIEDYTDEEIRYIMHWINNYPRKILGGKSANMLKEELELSNSSKAG